MFENVTNVKEIWLTNWNTDSSILIGRSISPLTTSFRTQINRSAVIGGRVPRGPQGRDRKRSREASLVTVVVAVVSEGVPFFWFFSFLLISLFRAFSFRSRLWQARKIHKWYGASVASRTVAYPVTVLPWHVNTHALRLIYKALVPPVLHRQIEQRMLT